LEEKITSHCRTQLFIHKALKKARVISLDTEHGTSMAQEHGQIRDTSLLLNLLKDQQLHNMDGQTQII
jgi:hypothetical protein